MRINLQTLLNKKGVEGIVMVAAYDAWMAKIVDEAVDIILVGDSLANVVQGQSTTLPVTLEEMIYHTRMVTRGSKKAFVITDLPFLSYQTSVRDAVLSGGRCLKEGFAQAVKLEGGKRVVPHIHALSESGIPVMAHLGLTPQSINMLGGYGKQAKSQAEAEILVEDASALQEAGASFIVLENIPYKLAAAVRRTVTIPTIGIGAGADCDGQVQVFHDLFGLDPDFAPRHATPFAQCGKDITKAIHKYAQSVRSGTLDSK